MDKLELGELEENVLLTGVDCSKLVGDELPAALLPKFEVELKTEVEDRMLLVVEGTLDELAAAELIVDVSDEAELGELKLERSDDDWVRLLEVDRTRDVEVKVLEIVGRELDDSVLELDSTDDDRRIELEDEAVVCTDELDEATTKFLE